MSLARETTLIFFVKHLSPLMYEVNLLVNPFFVVIYYRYSEDCFHI